MFKTALIVSGILAAIALSAPSIVTLGLFLLIIPGLVLALAPTVFVYLLLIAVIRWLLPLPPGPLGWVASVVMAIGIGWAVMQPMRWIETRKWEAELQPDVLPPAPLPLAGEIALDFPAPLGGKRAAEACDYLCAALLDTLGLTGVILGEGLSRRRISLAPRGPVSDRGLRPTEPEAILNLFDKVDAKRAPGERPRQRWEETKRMREALAAAWTLRLNTEQTLVATPVDRDTKADWTVRAISLADRGMPNVRRLEIHDREGELRLRRSLVTHSILAPIFTFEFVGSVESARFRVARTQLSSAGRYAEFDPAFEFLAHSVIRRPSAPPEAEDNLRGAVVAALDDPAASPERLLAARDWLQHLEYRVPERDEGLVLRIVEDRRVPDIANILNRFYHNSAPVAFRHAFVRRILDPATNAWDRDYYARMLARMPVGTFAEPTPGELDIWNDPKLYTEAAPFLERLADTGAPGLARITTLLREAAAIPSWAQRRPLVRELRRGLARMGRDAAPALSTVLEFLDRRGSPLTNVWQESQEWYKTMVLMGLPIEQVPLPNSFSPEQIARERERLREDVARYDPDKRSGYNY
jgi:hypothetical protein